MKNELLEANKMIENQVIENIVHSLLTSYRRDVNMQNINDVAMDLCCDRDFCSSIDMNFSNPDYSLVRLALLNYMRVR